MRRIVNSSIKIKKEEITGGGVRNFPWQNFFLRCANIFLKGTTACRIFFKTNLILNYGQFKPVATTYSLITQKLRGLKKCWT